MRQSLLLATLLALPALPVQAQTATGWRMVETTDELTATHDRRLILRADDWPKLPKNATPDEYKGATLVLACGDRLPSADSRSLLFFAGQPMEPYGGEGFGYAELRFDGKGTPVKAYMTQLNHGEAVSSPGGQRPDWYVAFLGEDKSPYFSQRLFERLLAATSLVIEYGAFGRNRTVAFQVGGLRQSLQQLSDCKWAP
jgi:hypothetical protein